MDKIKQLIDTNQLKTSYLSTLEQQSKLFFHYDNLSDTLMILFISPENETIVHYLDRYVAILYTPEDHEIVGLQIEDFQSDFIPMYSELQRAWCLRDFVVDNENVWDLTIKIEEQQHIIALEIIKAKQTVIGKSAEEFERVLEYA